MHGPLAVVGSPEACQYHGLCEMICPTDAISRPFEIVFIDGHDDDPHHRGDDHD